MISDDGVRCVLAACETPTSEEAVRLAFAKALDVECHRGGQIVGHLFFFGTEVHYVVAPECRGYGVSRRMVCEHLAPELGKLGFLTTSCLRSDATRREFLQRLGFKYTHAVMDLDYFMLSKLPFEKDRVA